MRIFASLLIVLSILSSCAAIKILKASETKNYGFIPKPELFDPAFDSTPFHRRWITEDASRYQELKTSLKEVYIEPVNTSILKAELEKEITDPDEQQARIDEVEELARYFRNKIALVLNDTPHKNFKLIETPGKNTIRLALALVEVEPTNPSINALGTAAGFFVPGGGLVKIAAKGGVAIEGFIDETNKQTLLEQFKDKESDKAAPFTVKDFQKYAHIRSSIDDWSMQLAEILNQPVGHKVKDSLPFELAIF